MPIATQLKNPRQLPLGPDGALYVAEAGSGKVGARIVGWCFSGPGGKACSGDTSSTTRIGSPATATGGSANRFRRGLLSVVAPDGSGAVGLDALTMTRTGIPYGVTTYLPPACPSDSPGSPACSPMLPGGWFRWPISGRTAWVIRWLATHRTATRMAPANNTLLTFADSCSARCGSSGTAALNRRGFGANLDRRRPASVFSTVVGGGAVWRLS